MAADTRITYVKDGNTAYEDKVRKIYKFMELPVGASYWGLARIDGKALSDILSDFDKAEVCSSDDVNSIAEKLRKYLEKYSPQIDRRMGLHVAGFCRDRKGEYPQIRHVFHMDYHEVGKLTNEDSNVERHSIKDGSKEAFPYDPFISLFNGDSGVATAFFNVLPYLYQGPKRTILPEELSLEQCVRLAKLLIETSGRIQDFLVSLNRGVPKQVGRTVSGPTMATITKTRGFEWLDSNTI